LRTHATQTEQPVSFSKSEYPSALSNKRVQPTPPFSDGCDYSNVAARLSCGPLARFAMDTLLEQTDRQFDARQIDDVREFAGPA